MIPNITRGADMGGLVSYLAGGGRHNEHTEQHLVAGDSAIMAMHGYAQLDGATARAIARSLDAPRVAFGVEVTRQVRVEDPVTGELHAESVPASVWHCSLSLHADEGQLSDEKWAAIAEDFVNRMGFTETSGKAACRWVAVRHGLSTNGNDHVHIAVSLVREDGTKASTHNDFRRAQDTCRELEREHGLAGLESRHRGVGERGVKPAEQDRVRRGLQPELETHRLERTVRAAGIASLDEGEFVRRLRRGGVLIRPRFAAGRDDVVAGYSVALRPTADEHVIWYGGGRLARDLTLPRLREGWPDSVESAQSAVDEWRATSKNPSGYRPVAPGREEAEPDFAMWDKHSRELAELRRQLRDVPVTDRSTWAHVAREAAGAFAAWSQRVEPVPGPLAATARDLARSAHIRAHQSRPKPVHLSSGAGIAAVLLQAAVGGRGTVAQSIVLRQLGRLAVAVMDAHSATGDAHRAEQLARTMRERFEAIERSQPAIPARADDAERSPDQGEDAIRVARQGYVPPGVGSPLPTTLTPQSRTSPTPARDRGDHGRD